MGCDIHATIEYTEMQGYWISQCRDIFIQRNYNLFRYLGVPYRGDDGITALAELRGVPEGASYEYQEEDREWDVDGHSHSYLYADELEKLPDEYKQDIWYKVVALTAEKYGTRNVRLCYFFDN